MSPKATHTRRLRRLADILERFRPTNGKRFDMNTWGRHDGSHHPEQEKNFCGTAACALGHAALDPKFRQAGLGVRWEEEPEYDYDVRPSRATGKVASYGATIHFRDHTAEDAGAAFFGLALKEAYDLFMRTSRSKSRVVALLRKYATDRAELRDEA